MKVNYVAIAVKDMEESVRFYSDVLGLQEVRRFEPQPGMTIVFMKGEGEGQIELISGIEKSEFSIDSAGALLLIGLEVEDMDATASVIRAKGVKFSRPPREVHSGTKIAFLKDPNGIELELIQHGKGNS